MKGHFYLIFCMTDMPPKKEEQPQKTVPPKGKGKGTGKSEVKKATSKKENGEKSEASTKSSKSGIRNDE